jgi:hypothetical protein
MSSTTRLELSPLDGNPVLAGKGFHPALIILVSLPQSPFDNGINVVHVTEEMDDVLFAGEQGADIPG